MTNFPAVLIEALTVPVIPNAICHAQSNMALLEEYWPIFSQDFRDAIADAKDRYEAMDIYMDAIDTITYGALY